MKPQYQNCTQCLNDSRHPFGVGFTNDGKCYGCITHSEKYDFDQIRFDKFLLRIGKEKTSTYDCVVPVKGDADDYFVLHNLLKVGLKPLVCFVNSYFNNDIGWKNLQNLITTFDVDSVSFNPKLDVYKNLVRYSLAKYRCVLLPYKFLFHSFATTIAANKKIPYIIYGENQPTEITGNFSNFDYPEKSEWQHVVFDFSNLDFVSFLGTGGQHSPQKLEMYNYNSRLARKVKGLYLSNYIPWDSLFNNQIALEYGFTPEKQKNTFDPFYRAGSSVYYGVHDFLRFKKFGYTKVRDQLNREIRFGRVSRAEALETYGLYSRSNFDRQPFYDWLGVSESGAQWLNDRVFKDIEGNNNNQETFDCYSKMPIGIKKLLPNRVTESVSQFVLFDKQI